MIHFALIEAYKYHQVDVLGAALIKISHGIKSPVPYSWRDKSEVERID